MSNDYIQKIKDLTLNPIETLQNLREESLTEAFLYFLVILAIYALLSCIVSTAVMTLFGGSLGFGASIFVIIFGLIFSIIGGIIALFIGAIIVHLFVYLLGGRKGFEQTVKAAIYSMTPLALIGWIPFVNIIAIIWSLIVEILAVRELQEISTARAALAIIIPLIIMIALVIITIIAFAAIAYAVFAAASPESMMMFNDTISYNVTTVTI